MKSFNINKTIFRYHNDDDLKSIAEIEAVSINPPWSLKAIEDFTKYETNKILIASYIGVIVGYITYSVVADEFQIANAATHPDYRRKGVAKNLLKTLYANAKTNGMSVITLEVRESNSPAIALYNSLGYKNVGIRKNYYKNPSENAILMNLYL